MKTKLFYVLSFLTAAGVALAAPGPAARGGCGPCPAGDCARLQADTTPIVLSDSAGAALSFQIDEERMARELYTAFGEKWDLRPFRNIVAAEERHEAVLQALALQAGVTVAPAQPGRFATAAVQERYDTLLAQGMKSAIDALQAGAHVEEQDIADLRTLTATTDSAELKQAVAALERGSQHHLNAFVRNLRGRGVTYQAQVLNPEEVTRLTAESRAGQCGRRARIWTTAPRPVCPSPSRMSRSSS